MNWLENAYRIYNDQELFDQEKEHRLSLDSDESLSNHLEGIKSITFSSTYHGMPITTILPRLLKEYPDVNSLHIYTYALTWSELCSLDLSSLTDLSVLIQGDLTQEQLVAPLLKKLSVMGSATDTYSPIELLIAPVSYIDFSSMPLLEDLRIDHIPKTNPMDFQNACNLKKLRIHDSEIHNLDWLRCASYRLESLLLDCDIDDCNGLIYQPALRELTIYHHSLHNISPITSLHHLEKLEVRFGSKINDAALRNLDIREVLISPLDIDLYRAKMDVKDMLVRAVTRYRYQNRQFQQISEMPDNKRQTYQKIMTMPFDSRIKAEVLSIFSSQLKRLKETDKIMGITMPISEWQKLFIEESLEYFPFLKKE